MISTDLLLFILFVLFLVAFLIWKRKKVEFQKIISYFVYFVMYRAKWGINAMDKLAKKFPRFWNCVSYLSIFTGFAGMVFILVFLGIQIYEYLFLDGLPPIQPLLPGVTTAPGLPTISALHWILAIAILATVHEFSHGLFARVNKIRVKASGFAFLGIVLPILPAAFVEPDEKQMVKSSKKAQYSLLSAGPFANVVTAAIFLVLFIFVMAPATDGIVELKGVYIANVLEESPAALAGMQHNETILSVNGQEVETVEEFQEKMAEVEPYQVTEITTDKNTYSVTPEPDPKEESRAILGINIIHKEKNLNPEKVAKYGSFPLQAFQWLTLLVLWIWVTNLGVGLINLLPIGPLDGGKMSLLFLTGIIKNEKKAKTFWKWMSIIIGLIVAVLLIEQFFNIFMNLIT